MNSLLSSFRFFKKGCKSAAWPVFAGLIIFAGIVFTLVRLWLPEADHYRADIERWTSDYIGFPVTLGAIHVRWDRLHPQLVIKDACLSKKAGSNDVMCVKEVHLALDLLTLLKGESPEFGDLTLVGVNISVLRRVDGSFAIVGLEDMPADPHMQELMQQWLMKQDYLIIRDSQLRWHDERNGQVRQFTHANLGLHNKGDAHYLSGTVSVAPDPATKIKIMLDLQGDIFGSSGWSGNGYVEGVAVDVAQWLAGRALAGVEVDAGHADLKIWGIWENARLQRVRGEAKLSQLQLKSAVQPLLAMQVFTGHFDWRRQARGWRLDADRVTVTYAGHANEKASDKKMGFQVALSEDDGSSVMELGAHHMQLQDGLALVLLSNVIDDTTREALTVMRPSAQLDKTYIRYNHDKVTGKNAFIARTRFDDLDASRWKNLPGITGLDGVLQINDQSGSLILDTAVTQLAFGDLFRSPLSMNTLTGVVVWQRQEGMWRIQAHELKVENADIGGSVNAVIDLPDDGGSPFVDLVADFSNGNVEHAARYFPVSIMPQDTITWLDRSLISGQVTTGQALFHGRVADFPFDGGTGRFEVRFNVSEGVLDYAPGWPRLEKIATEVVFSERRMDIHAVTAQSLASDIRQVHASIEDLDGNPALLRIKGKAEGPTADALRYVRESPLDKDIGKYFGSARTQGRSALNLALDIPLTETATNRIKGALDFNNSSLIFTDTGMDTGSGGGVELSAINGTLNFTETSLAARDIRATVLGQSTGVDVITEAGKGGALRFEARGRVDTQVLAQYVKSPLLAYFSGESGWLATLRVVDTDKETVNATLRIESPLKGMVVALPAPLGKTAMQQRGIVVETVFPRTASTPFNVKYGDSVKSVFSVGHDNVPDRGELRLGNSAGDSNLTLPAAPGWRVAGELPEFSVTEWLNFMGAEPRNTASPTAPRVNDVDVRIAAFEAFGHALKNVQIQAINNVQEWDATITSPKVSGRLRLPHAASAPVTADFDYIELARGGDKNRDAGDYTPDPYQIPPLRITSKRFSYYGMNLGSLSLITSPQPAGLHVDSLQIVSGATQITGLGDWTVGKQGQNSSFNLTINSNNLGKTFREFGFADTFAEGYGRVDLMAHWPSAPAAFTLGQLQGNLRMNLKKGRLLDVDPGAGRLFGLMALNFKGLFSKGFSFDDISGDFAITDGNAYTSNLTMVGPSAQVAVQGRVGLAARDYDQSITVTPRSSSALPLAGVLTGGPGLGAAIFLFQKLFQSELDRITRYQYTVKGAWDNPEFDLSSKDKETPPADAVTGPR